MCAVVLTTLNGDLRNVEHVGIDLGLLSVPVVERVHHYRPLVVVARTEVKLHVRAEQKPPCSIGSEAESVNEFQ